ncbi:MAG: WG repeat-containing protein [Proteobacteria bacterium]|nr:WG repeat-containing protein [Pseudomonadota bacterium]
MVSLVRFAKVVGLSVVLGTSLSACSKTRTEVISPDLPLSSSEAHESLLPPLMSIRADATRLPDGALHEEKTIIAVGGGTRFIDTDGNIVFSGRRSVLDAFLLENGRVYWVVENSSNDVVVLTYDDNEAKTDSESEGEANGESESENDNEDDVYHDEYESHGLGQHGCKADEGWDARVSDLTKGEKVIWAPCLGGGEVDFYLSNMGEAFMYLNHSEVHFQENHALMNRKGEWLFGPASHDIRFYVSPDLDEAGWSFVVAYCSPEEARRNLIKPQDDLDLGNLGHHHGCCIFSLHTGERIHTGDLHYCGELNPSMNPVLFPVMTDGGWGYLNPHGEMIIPGQFKAANSFVNGRGVAKLSFEHAEALCGSAKYPSQMENANVLAACKDGGIETWKKTEQLCSDRRLGTDESIVGLCGDHCYSPEAAIGVCEWIEFPFGWALIDERGQVISRFDYQAIVPFRDGFAIAKRGGQYGVIGVDGREIIPPGFEEKTGATEAAIAQGLWTDDDTHDKTHKDGTSRPESVTTAWGSLNHNGSLAGEGFCTTKSLSGGLILAIMDCRAVSEDDAEVDRIVVRGMGNNGELVTPTRRWSEDVSRKGYGVVDHQGNWLVSYRIHSQPQSTIRGLSFFEIRGESEYEKGWINAAGRIIWPPGWGDPAADTGGNVIWVE